MKRWLALVAVLLCFGMTGVWASEDEWWLEPRAEPAADAAPLSSNPSPLAGEGGDVR